MSERKLEKEKETKRKRNKKKKKQKEKETKRKRKEAIARSLILCTFASLTHSIYKWVQITCFPYYSNTNGVQM